LYVNGTRQSIALTVPTYSKNETAKSRETQKDIFTSQAFHEENLIAVRSTSHPGVAGNRITTTHAGRLITLMHRSRDAFHKTGLTALVNPSFSNEKRIEWMLSGSRAEPWAVFGFAFWLSKTAGDKWARPGGRRPTLLWP
jgi:hypothetical protein